jgi:hypothetical protein
MGKVGACGRLTIEAGEAHLKDLPKCEYCAPYAENSFPRKRIRTGAEQGPRS